MEVEVRLRTAGTALRTEPAQPLPVVEHVPVVRAHPGSITTSLGLLRVDDLTHSRSAIPSARTTAVSSLGDDRHLDRNTSLGLPHHFHPRQPASLPPVRLAVFTFPTA